MGRRRSRIPGAPVNTSQSYDRGDLSEVLKGQLYLTALPTIRKHFSAPQDTLQNALVISCNDWHEISNFPEKVTEAGATHFMLAMQDVSGDIDDIEHLIDAIHLAAIKYQAGNKVFIHCRAGVGRSVMLTYTFIAYLYLCNDREITARIDELAENSLDPSKTDFIEKLVKACYNYVYSIRGCSQFDGKSDLSIQALTLIKKRIDDKKPIHCIRKGHEDFLCQLIQTPEFKQLIIHHYFRRATEREKKLYSYEAHKFIGSKLLDNILFNEFNWKAILNQHIDMLANQDNMEVMQLLQNLRDRIQEIRKQHPAEIAARTQMKIAEFISKYAKSQRELFVNPKYETVVQYSSKRVLSYYKERLRDFQLSTTQIPDRPVIVDLACGDNFFHFFEMFRYFEDFIYIGVDKIKPSYITEALSTVYPDNFYYIQKDLFEVAGIENAVREILGETHFADLVLLEELFSCGDTAKIYSVTLNALVPSLLKPNAQLHVFPTHSDDIEKVSSLLENNSTYQSITEVYNGNFNLTYLGEALTETSTPTMGNNTF